MSTPDPVPSAANATCERHIDSLLARLDLDAKTRLLSGASMWAVAPNPDIGLGRLVMSDGPVGVRGERWTPDDPSIQLPSPTAIAATWDTGLVRRVGHLLAQEAHRKGVHVLLAPVVNLHRSPLGGRHFECFSEDPYLTGLIGAAYVAGVQDGGVATTVKHFVANDAETDRYTVDNRVDERTLREIYLVPFETVVRQAEPWGLMAAYNAVNGATMTEHAELNAVLREEWGFDGFIVSDWLAARDTVRDALAGMDSAMPGPDTVYGAHLAAAVRDGRVPEAAVDAMARRMLRLAARVGLLDGVAPAVPPTDRPAPVDGRALARETAARSFVLLKNEPVTAPAPRATGSSTPPLPIDPATTRTVALIGLAASEARTSGGGSATVFAERTVSPLDGLRAALPENVELRYAVGADPRDSLPVMRGPLTATFYDAHDAVLAHEPLVDGAARWIGELPDGVTPDRLDRVEVTGTVTPRASGAHTFGLSGVGRFRLAVGETVVFDGATVFEGDDLAGGLFNPPREEHTVEVTAGAPVEVTLAHWTNGQPLAEFIFIGFTLNHAESLAEDETLIAEAAAVAADADVAVVIAATTEDVESEGFDRTSLTLPGHQDELVRRVAAANPATVVVVNAGAPVEMPWRDDVAAILLTWFGGQELGAALADVLLGTAEPGGRLPTTWPVAEKDVPVLEVRPSDGRLDYAEGVFVGYRAWERVGTEPAYWFGHGLGYTEWRYEAAEPVTGPDGAGGGTTEGSSDGRPGSDDAPLGTFRVRLANIGHRAGREVVQVYLEPAGDGPAGVERPRRWLAGFAVVAAEPGQAVEAVVTVPRRAVQVWDVDTHAWRTVPGGYTVRVGRSYADLRLSVPVTVE